MPCYEPDDHRRTRTVIEYQDNPKLAAALCGVMGVLENDGYMDLLDRIDWNEQGITKKWLLNWWKDHKEQDKFNKRISSMMSNHIRNKKK